MIYCGFLHPVLFYSVVVYCDQSHFKLAERWLDTVEHFLLHPIVTMIPQNRMQDTKVFHSILPIWETSNILAISVLCHTKLFTSTYTRPSGASVLRINIPPLYNHTGLLWKNFHDSNNFTLLRIYWTLTHYASIMLPIERLIDSTGAAWWTCYRYSIYFFDF